MQPAVEIISPAATSHLVLRIIVASRGALVTGSFPLQGIRSGLRSSGVAIAAARCHASLVGEARHLPYRDAILRRLGASGFQRPRFQFLSPCAEGAELIDRRARRRER